MGETVAPRGVAEAAQRDCRLWHLDAVPVKLARRPPDHVVPLDVAGLAAHHVVSTFGASISGHHISAIVVTLAMASLRHPVEGLDVAVG